MKSGEELRSGMSSLSDHNSCLEEFVVGDMFGVSCFR